MKSIFDSRLSTFQDRLASYEERKAIKLNHLQEQKNEKEIEGCTFEPKLRNQSTSQSRRDLTQFYLDQQKHIKLKEDKVEQQKQLNERKIQKETKLKPQISKISEKIADRKNKEQGKDVFNRLYDRRDRTPDLMKAETQIENKPKIRDLSDPN